MQPPGVEEGGGGGDMGARGPPASPVRAHTCHGLGRLLPGWVSSHVTVSPCRSHTLCKYLL